MKALPAPPPLTLVQHMRLWLLRLTLAALLLASHEVLLWANIQNLTVTDWAIRGVAYIALATLLLDIATRYRIRDVYDGMALLAIYAAIGGLLISPDISFSDFPRTLVTRVLGAYCLTGSVAFGIFLVLTSNERRYRVLLVAGMAWVGFYWGTWLRWTPEIGSLFSQPVTLNTMFAYAAALFSIGFALYALTLRPIATITANDFKLPLVPGMVLILVLLLVFMVRAVQNQVNGTAVILCLVIVGIGVTILWFRRTPKGAMLLDEHIPPRRMSIRWLLLTILIFALTTLAAYSLPLIGTPEYNQLWLMEIGYVGVGISWLPTLAAVIAARGIDRQMRAQRLDV